MQQLSEITHSTKDSRIYGVNEYTTSPVRTQEQNQNIRMTWLIQQHLSQIRMPIFEGSTFNWVEFITKSNDVIYTCSKHASQ